MFGDVRPIFQSIIIMKIKPIIHFATSPPPQPSSVSNSQSPGLHSPPCQTLPPHPWSRSPAQVKFKLLFYIHFDLSPTTILRRRVLRVPPPIIHGWTPLSRDTNYTTLACNLSCSGTTSSSTAKTIKTTKTPVCSKNRRGAQYRRR